ncbi:methylated-DNA--[protein]-cysteine S-methyltransferase [Sphingomonas oligophenolica]|uniref:Methylated-DNA--[protein]-cysteine S-methyltransferase n=1 Tax=Sphingomonas oligophenolica TaxID=301154 RepID=A0A502CRU6_9SPHN|nr:methylated-DNA--[protein]-cysteine S-methyltransferase [Sphingomonas oligophenolica]TPG15608.1 methylated-DNA--[protein]-cysteine S-methyltransferase [Sphingomonas oligophenolica]
MATRETASLPTPIGMTDVDAIDGVITRIAIDPSPARSATATPLDPTLQAAMNQLAAYFAGQLTVFDLPLAPAATPRGAALRQAIVDIGYGDTARYGEIAATIGSSARALGQACARNPFPIVVPCHRVLSTGPNDHYSAGNGVATKRWLLTHEHEGSS